MKLRHCIECAAPLTQRDATEYVCANGHGYRNEPHAGVCVEPQAGDDAAALVWRPVDAVESDEFAWHIPGLAAKLRALAAVSR